MDYSIKKLPKSEVEIKVTVSADKMPEYRKKACDNLSKEVEIKGFRKGHVPSHILEDYLDKKLIEVHTVEIAIQQSYVDVVIKEKLQIISRPRVKVEKDDPLTYTAIVVVLPEVEIKNYKSIKIKKKDTNVSKKDIEDVVEDMKKYGTLYKDVSREAKKGDRVEVDFEGFEGDKPLPSTKSTNHPVIVGDNVMVPGFEDNLIGMKKSEEKEFDIVFPKKYHKKDFQNKKVTFKVKLTRIEEPETPEFNDALIERLSGKKQTVEEFKQDVEKNIKAKKEQEAKHKQENDYLEELLKLTKIEIPDSLIDEELEFIIEEMKADIEKKGLVFKQFLEQVKITEDDLRKKYRVEAEKRIKVRLALQYLIKEEKIEVSDEETKNEFEKLKTIYPKDQQKKIEAEFDSGELAAQLRNRLALGKLFDKVKL